MWKAILVDDEVKGTENLSLLLNRLCPEVEVKGIAHTLLDTLDLVLQVKPDIAFLDIHMPDFSGLEVAEKIKTAVPYIIFVTAHQEYAIQALRAGAQDYLLKPVDDDDLLACIKRLKQQLPAEKKQTSGGSILKIPVKDGFLFIRRDELLRVEGAGSYAYIIMSNGVRHLVSKSIGEIDKMLAGDAQFFRCHNSHIVHLGKVIRFVNKDGYFVQMADGSLPDVSRKYKDQLLELLNW